MTVLMDGHIVVDDRGLARIAGSRSRVVDVVLDRRAYGWTPEQIHENYPHLSLAQIHAAFAYYYSHQTELDALIDEQLRLMDDLAVEAGEPPFVARLRAEGKLR